MAKNEDREDFLEEDPEISGQKFVLLSFLSPEKVLANKNLFLFNKFLEVYEFLARTKSMEEYLMKTVSEVNAKIDAEADKMDAHDLSGAATLLRGSRIRMDTLMSEYQDFVKVHQKELKESKLKENFDDFLYQHKAKLEDEFFAANEFRTTVRGLKVRGTYGSQAEAVARSKKLQRVDPLHNIFVGEVGKWLPWDPEPNDIAEQEYAEDQLNTLMKKYKENEEARESFQREQRASKIAGAKRGTGAPLTITREDEAGAAVNAAATAEGAENYSGMFGSSGPADLVMQRKMEAAAAAKKE
jgi:hypothetical protein